MAIGIKTNFSPINKHLGNIEGKTIMGKENE